MRDRLAAWRNRLVASPAFQRFAAGFPLTRPIATRQSQALFDLCAGFVYAQILAACVKLDLFEMLEPAPLDLPTLASRTGLSEAAAERLLKGAVALKLLERRSGGRYGLAMLGAAMRGNPGIARMIAHHHLLYADLADPVALLRGEVSPTQLSTFWGYAVSPNPSAAAQEAVAAYSALMSAPSISSPTTSSRLMISAAITRCWMSAAGRGPFSAPLPATPPLSASPCSICPPSRIAPQRASLRKGSPPVPVRAAATCIAIRCLKVPIW